MTQTASVAFPMAEDSSSRETTVGGLICEVLTRSGPTNEGIHSLGNGIDVRTDLLCSGDDGSVCEGKECDSDDGRDVKGPDGFKITCI